MRHHMTLLASASMLLLSLSTGCSYLDEEIHLSDEQFELGVNGVGLSGHGSYRSGCGGGYMSYSHKSTRRVKGVLDLGELDILGEVDTAQPSDLDASRRHRGSIDSFALLEGEEEEADEEVEATTNHDVLTLIASEHVLP